MFGFFKKKESTAEVKEDSRRIDGVVRDDDEFHQGTVGFLANLCGILVKSYGPLGSNTLIEKLGSTPTVTKDGYTILENLRFSNSQDKALHDLIKRVSYNLVKTVGDGSTSAVLSASFMYEYLSGLRETPKYTRKQLIDVLERIVTYLEEDMTVNCRKIDDGNRHSVLTSIASISNNNDVKIGDYIAGLFNKLSYLSDIRIEEDPRDSNVPLSHSTRYGFTFDRGPIHNLYFNQVGKSALVVKEPLIYMSYEFFPDHYDNLKEIQKAHPDRPIVAIVEVTHEETVNDCLSDFLKGKNKVVLIRANDLSMENAHNEFLDLAIYLDSDCVRDPKNFKLEQLGACKSVELFGTKTMFIGGDGLVKSTPFYLERVEQLNKEYDDIPNNLPAQRGAVRVRLSKLSGVTVKVLVGGITEEEKKARRYLVEDAVLACKSAINKGYGFGGNVNLYFAMKQLNSRFDSIYKNDYVFQQFDEEYIRLIFQRLVMVYFDTYFCIASKSPQAKADHEGFRTILQGVDDKIFNVMTGNLESIEDTTVLAPIDTDIQILKASVSIVGMLLSINQFVSC
jgi:chaperonin GroEL